MRILVKLHVMFWFSLLSIFLLLVGCGGNNQESEPNSGKLRVLSTTLQVQDLVMRVGKERVEGSVLISGAIDPHSYELVKGDGEKISSAHLVFANGLGLEHGASLRYQMACHPHAVALGDVLLSQGSEKLIYVEGQCDPHIWMDVSLWKEGLAVITEALSQEDPEGRLFYEKNAELAKQELAALDRKIAAELSELPSQKRFLVTSHDAFNYFVRRYLADAGEQHTEAWRSRCKAPEGLAPEGQLSAADLQAVIHYLIDKNIRILFPESNVNRDALRKIVSVCREKGVEVKLSAQSLYGDAMGARGSGAENYPEMMEHNTLVIKRGLSE